MRSYPQFRKSANALHLYKIISEKEFIELQSVGNRVFRYVIIADQYPEMVRINDMLELNGFQMATAEEFENSAAKTK